MDIAKNRIFKRLIREYEFLLEDYEDVAEIHKQANVEMSSELNKVKPKDVFEADYLEVESDTEELKEPNHNDKDLKKLFRKIVFVCHPDKVKAEADERRRSELAGYYNQAVNAHDDGNWALMVVIAVKLEIELPNEAEAQIDKIQEDTNKLREKINTITRSYVWEWYQAEERKRKEMLDTYISLLTKSIRSKSSEKKDKESKLILGVGHPRTGTGYTAKLLQSWGLDVGHEKMGEHGTVDWSLSPGGKSLWQDINVKDYNWQWIIYCVRDPRYSIPSIIFTEEENIASSKFRSKHGIREDHNPIVRAIESIVKWDKMIESMKPTFTYRIEDQGLQLFEFLSKNEAGVKWSDQYIDKPQNTREHPSWEDLISKNRYVLSRYRNMINNFCSKYGYDLLF